MVVPKPNPTKDKLMKLISDREKLEAKISAAGEILAANDNVGMSGPLVTPDGFPRNDIDVYQVRHARQQVICLQNDHKELMKLIENLMHKLHAEAAAEDQDLTGKTAVMQLDNDNDNESDAGTSSSTQSPLCVIVKVNVVSPGSPAEDAGLRVGDKIIEFGTINSNNFENLNQIAAIVRHMQNQRITLKVQREQQLLSLMLIPKTWAGHGLLGCNILLPEVIER